MAPRAWAETSRDTYMYRKLASTCTLTCIYLCLYVTRYFSPGQARLSTFPSLFNFRVLERRRPGPRLHVHHTPCLMTPPFHKSLLLQACMIVCIHKVLPTLCWQSNNYGSPPCVYITSDVLWDITSNYTHSRAFYCFLDCSAGVTPDDGDGSSTNTIAIAVGVTFLVLLLMHWLL